MPLDCFGSMGHKTRCRATVPHACLFLATVWVDGMGAVHRGVARVPRPVSYRRCSLRAGRGAGRTAPATGHPDRPGRSASPMGHRVAATAGGLYRRVALLPGRALPHDGRATAAQGLRRATRAGFDLHARSPPRPRPLALPRRRQALAHPLQPIRRRKNPPAPDTRRTPRRGADVFPTSRRGVFHRCRCDR